MIEIAAQVPLSPHFSDPPGQPARDGKVGGSHRVGAHSETKGIQIQTNTYIYPAAVQQQWRSAAAAGASAPPVPLPPGQPAQQKAEGLGPLLSMPVCFLSARVRHSRQDDTRDGREFQHSSGIEAMSPDSLRSALSTQAE